MWSPNTPGDDKDPSYYTQTPSERIGGLRVPKTTKVMTRRSSTSMNKELDARLNNFKMSDERDQY